MNALAHAALSVGGPRCAGPPVAATPPKDHLFRAVLCVAISEKGQAHRIVEICSQATTSTPEIIAKPAVNPATTTTSGWA
jgi:hypothetical protein